MTASTYPAGINNLVLRGIPITMMHPGRVFYVSNADVLFVDGQQVVGADRAGLGTFARPFRTYDFAIGEVTASRGDMIVLMPGHAENIASAAAITSDVAGLATVGLGVGSLRPKFSFTAAASTHVISAANQTFHNIQWEANFADVAQGLDVSGVDGLSWDNCWFTEAGTDLNYVDTINLATGADDLAWTNCRFIGNDASNDQFITGIAHDGFYMDNCMLHMNTAQASAVGLIDSTGNVTNVRIKDCDFRSNVDGASFVDFNGAANSGTMSRCNFSSLDVAGAVTGGFDFTGGHIFECYVAGEANSFGIVGGGTVYNNA